MSGNNTFGYLGLDYQERLIAQLVTDIKFANNILDIIDPNFFEDELLRIIVCELKDAYEIDEIILDLKAIEYRLSNRIKNNFQLEFIKNQLTKISQINLNDSLSIQKTAMLFCKQQEAKKAVKKVDKIIEKGNLEDYSEIEDIFKKVLEIGDNKDDSIDVFHNIDDILADDFRNPIATGIYGLDRIMNGGLSRGELAIILAPFGVGKTTMITKIANTAKNLGLNVLQIFFEDNPKVIQRKHLTCWGGGKWNLNELSNYKEEIISLAKEKKSESGILKLKKFSSDGTTMPMIKQYVRKQIAKGFKPDIILIDYIDCIQPSKNYGDTNVAEGAIMRQFETMLDEFNMAGWTAIQGNRSSIGANVVESNQIGGSIKKGQIGHFIVSIAKTLEQKENNTANMAILKSRFGKDGIIFNDVIFDNGTLQIEIVERNEEKTFLETKDIKKEKDLQRINYVLNSVNKLKESDENE